MIPMASRIDWLARTLTLPSARKWRSRYNGCEKALELKVEERTIELKRANEQLLADIVMRRRAEGSARRGSAFPPRAD